MEFTDEELAKYRRVLAPLFRDRTITGFNIYPEIYEGKTRFAVSYLHEDLDENNPHKVELLDRIAENHLAHLITTIVGRIVRRRAVYLSPQIWFDNRRPNVYDFEGNPIPTERINEFEEFLQEDLQYDMTLDVDNEKDLADLLQVFDKHANKFKIDARGNILEGELNPDKIKHNPWDIPVVLVRSQNFIYPTYAPAEKFAIRKSKSEISTIVTNTADTLARKLDGAQIEVLRLHLLANRGFVNWITIRT
jgi:hypothetical protein